MRSAARPNHTGPVFPPAMAVSPRGVAHFWRRGRSPRYHWSMPASTPERIYLDHNATTPVFPEVVEAMRACWSEPYLNPASQHEFGRRARRVLEDARDRIAELLGATHHATASSSPAAAPNPTTSPSAACFREPGAARRVNVRRRRSTATSSFPRSNTPASPRSPKHLSASSACHVDNLAVDAERRHSHRSIWQRLHQPNTRLVAAMLANNETGVIQPIAELRRDLQRAQRPTPHRRRPSGRQVATEFRRTGRRHDDHRRPQIRRPAWHRRARRARRHSTRAATLRRRPTSRHPPRHRIRRTRRRHANRARTVGQKPKRMARPHLQSLRDEFETSLLKGAHNMPARRSSVRTADRLPTTSNIAFVGLDRQALFVALDQAGVACSTGSACASGSSEPSPVHIAMGCDPAVISSALRFSFGVQTTTAEVAESADRILRICNNLRSQKQS